MSTKKNAPIVVSEDMSVSDMMKAFHDALRALFRAVKGDADLSKIARGDLRGLANGIEGPNRARSNKHIGEISDVILKKAERGELPDDIKVAVKGDSRAIADKLEPRKKDRGDKILTADVDV